MTMQSQVTTHLSLLVWCLAPEQRAPYLRPVSETCAKVVAEQLCCVCSCQIAAGVHMFVKDMAANTVALEAPACAATVTQPPAAEKPLVQPKMECTSQLAESAQAGADSGSAADASESTQSIGDDSA